VFRIASSRTAVQTLLEVPLYVSLCTISCGPCQKHAWLPRRQSPQLDWTAAAHHETDRISKVGITAADYATATSERPVVEL
jgi:hypothetical protein